MTTGVKVALGVAIVAAVAAGFAYQRFGPINIPSQEPLVPSEELPFAVPEGFTMYTYAAGVPGARVLAHAPGGAMLVSQPSEGKVSALLPDADQDGRADGVVEVLGGLDGPHGLAFRCPFVETLNTCELYVATEGALMVYEYDAGTHSARNPRELLSLPTDGGHSTRSLVLLGSPEDTTLLVSVGSSCNVCDEDDARRASIIAYNVETGASRQYAKGLRNAVFMALHPVSGEVWATEMGRDQLGDDIPPDEINIVREGGNYGWPICYGKNIHDTQFDKKTYIRNPCMTPFETPSHVDLQAHSAPLGLAFVPEEGWPEGWWHNALVAYHGSWNRSEPTGYKVVRVVVDADGRYSGTEDFITGWLTADGTRVGRPVAILAEPGGTLYISDDGAGVVYRMVRTAGE